MQIVDELEIADSRRCFVRYSAPVRDARGWATRSTSTSRRAAPTRSSGRSGIRPRVIVCTGANGRRRAAALGASDFLTKPFTRDVLMDTISKLLPDRGGDVLVVDDDDTLRKLVGVTLAAEGHVIREAADGEEALAAIGESRPERPMLRTRAISLLEKSDYSPDELRDLASRAVGV